MLKQIKSSLQSLEPLESGYIHESFLLNNLEEGLQQTKKMTALLTEEANDSIRSVRDIIPLSTLQADDFLEDIYQAQKYRNTTMEKLYAFDKQQAFILSETTHDLYQMRKYIQDIQSQFQSGAWSITGYEAGQLSESGITFVAAAEKPNVTAPASEEILACEAPVAEKEKVDDLNNFLLKGASWLLDITPGSPGNMRKGIAVVTGKDYMFRKELTMKERSQLLDSIPFVSDGKAAIEALTNKDLMTQEELSMSTVDRVIDVVSVLGGPYLKVGKQIFNVAEQFKKVQHVLNPKKIKSVMDDAYKQATKLVRGIPGKVQEMKQSILDTQFSVVPGFVTIGGGAGGRTVGDVVEEGKEQIYTFAKNIKNEAKATVNEVKSLFGGNKGTDNSVPSYGKKSVPMGPYREAYGFSVKVKPGAQEKHIPNTPNYKQEIANGKNKSIFYGDNKTAQELLDKFAGKGQLLPNRKKERVDFGKPIGKYYDGDTGEYLETTRGMIHYGKDGAHIVPSEPLKK